MIVGTATFRIVLSSTMMNNVLDRITSAIQRFGSAGPAGAPQLAACVSVIDVLSLYGATRPHIPGAEP